MVWINVAVSVGHGYKMFLLLYISRDLWSKTCIRLSLEDVRWQPKQGMLIKGLWLCEPKRELIYYVFRVALDKMR